MSINVWWSDFKLGITFEKSHDHERTEPKLFKAWKCILMLMMNFENIWNFGTLVSSQSVMKNQKTDHVIKQTKLFLRIYKTIEFATKKFSNFSKQFNLRHQMERIECIQSRRPCQHLRKWMVRYGESGRSGGNGLSVKNCTILSRIGPPFV